MSFWRKAACAVLLLVLAVSLAASWLAPAGYAKQDRDAAGAPPSHAHWLGTDEIGRDRFARVLYGTRISLLLAPAAALCSTLLAALIGGLAGYLGGSWARAAMRIAVIRRMIAIIRDYEKEEFVWESRRLGRNVTLSAKQADNAALEEFMMHEFFDGRAY